MPARCWTWLPGSQQAPPEYAEVPPSSPVFSTTTVDSPALWARKAPVIAPPPEPTTTTSYSCASVMRSILEQVLHRWFRGSLRSHLNHRGSVVEVRGAPATSLETTHRAQLVSHDRAPDPLSAGAAGHPAP